MSRELSAKDKELKARVEKNLQRGDASPFFISGRRLFALLPRDPRCMICLAPFEGIGGTLVRAVMNKRRSSLNPLMCNKCEEMIRRLEYGAEVEMSMLFADIRGSTPIAESMNLTEFKELINRFYSETTHVLAHSLAVLGGLDGDEVSGFYIPSFVGDIFARRSVEAAKEVLRVTGHEDPEGPWVPVGVGIHTGTAYFGAVSSIDGLVEFTALGDAVNVASRLASQAAAGEVVISESTALKAGINITDLEKRSLSLKGKSESMVVWIIRIMRN